MSQPTNTFTSDKQPNEKRNDVKPEQGKIETAAHAAVHTAARIENKIENKVEGTAHTLAAQLQDKVERVQDKVEHGASATSDMVGELKEQAVSLGHDAREAASDAYDHAVEVVEDVAERAQELGSDAIEYAGRIGAATGRFMYAHAMPLGLIATGIGWLGMSMKRARTTPRMRTTAVPRRFDANTRMRTRDDTLELREPRETRATREPTATVSGKKLMGVRTGRTGYEV